jgi:predicted O-linked N-acetylglucosamine transferase (SPINDLY family)
VETLWVGIPLVTRVGQQFAARNSYGFLTQVGVSEGVAWTDGEYLAWGIRFGQDRDLRMQVRERLLSARHDSPLWQEKRFTREMEKAFCAMWDQFCQQNRLIGVG